MGYIDMCCLKGHGFSAVFSAADVALRSFPGPGTKRITYKV